MPTEGYTTITVSEEVKKELKERAEKEGLSLAQLIEQYMSDAYTLNDLLWLKQPQRVQDRIHEVSEIIYSELTGRWHKKRDIELRKEGLSIHDKPLSYEEQTKMETEMRDLAYEIAKAVIEKNEETYENLKNQDEERKLKFHLSQSSHESKHVELDPITKRLVSVTYKSNAEVYHDRLVGIANRLEVIFSQGKSKLDIMKKNIVEIGDLANQWNNLRKYVPYLSDEDKALDEKIAEILGV